ncbi:hypothetical protein DKM27_18595, partial [Mycobacterium tuberculosis variant bovis]
MNSNGSSASPAPARAGRRCPTTGFVDRHRHLDDLGAGFGERAPAQTGAVDADRGGLGAAGDGDADQLQRRLGWPDEQLGRERRRHFHAET